VHQHTDDEVFLDRYLKTNVFMKSIVLSISVELKGLRFVRSLYSEETEKGTAAIATIA
jgi:hypothetical protein